MVTRVDEKGSEGAAATAIFTSRMMFVPKVKPELRFVATVTTSGSVKFLPDV